ncbi:MAG: sugar phosphate nucleotidyltransferase [Candidatus Marinimicrobia bacterium]|jgi:UTP-glucose-1-phosphate uridylyltransferase|nr:sugar phosphate nucleotidyltransferase [Candidatus Neomarinimicrobiota bacterium]
MINHLTLLVMAAGMGSRYGGLKQLDKVGPNGETIIDYSLHDAIKAGFTKVIFIIRRDFEDQFKLQITNKYLGKFAVEFAFQDIDDLPNGFSCPSGREKPWGTGQAILSARNLINEPFVVINGDDYYGQESFKVIADYYNNGGAQFSMVAFRLDKTLSDFGPVTRGVCNVENDKLDTVVETENLEKKGNYILTNRDITLDGSEPVSMNMWGFTPSLFNYLHEDFVNFLNDEGGELKSEFLIPTVINNLVQNNQEEVYVLRSNASWFGVTYKEDKPFVINKIQELIHSGIYSSPLL